VQILFVDNGIGFDEAHAGHLFEPFKRLVGKNQSRYDGSGMGLAICRWIVERHGGEITASSKSGQGTTFIVTLPIRLK
jgi:signal transduction histidine kinase